MVKTWLVLMFFTSMITGCMTSTKDPIEEQEEHISMIEKEDLSSEYVFWHGRNHFLDDKQYFYYTATGFKISFYGRIIDIELSLEHKENNIYYQIAKDGQDLLDGDIFIQSQSSQILTVTFDTYEQHTVEVVKRSEPEDGITALVKVTTNGYLTKQETSEEKPPHFLIIGASGISGHGALGTPNQGRTTANSSSLHSFGYLTALHYQGTFEFVSNSGWGLAFGYNDTSGVQNIQKAYENVGIHPNRTVIEGDYDNHKTPDIIIVNIGGNDYTSVINNLSGFARENKIMEFRAAVASFVLKLRSDAPNAHIFWTMTAGSLNGNAALQVFNQLDEIDKAYVHMVIIEQVASNGDLAGANNHASFITHQRSTQNLIDAINGLNLEIFQ